MSCHCCFVPSKTHQHIWCGDATHCKVCHICPEDCSRESICILPKSLIPAPSSATPSLPFYRGKARTALHFQMALKRIKHAHKVNKSEITLHMMHSPRQQTSLSPMNTSVSCAPFATLDPSSTTASAKMMTSQH